MWNNGSRHSRIQSSRVRRDSRRRGREKRSSAPPLATLGSRVDIPPRIFPKHGGLTEGCTTSGPVLLASTPGAVPENGRKPGSISLRSLERAWLKQHQAEYAGEWVALEGARLVARGSSPQQVLDAASADGYAQPLVVHIPSESQLPFGGW